MILGNSPNGHWHCGLGVNGLITYQSPTFFLWCYVDVEVDQEAASWSSSDVLYLIQKGATLRLHTHGIIIHRSRARLSTSNPFELISGSILFSIGHQLQPDSHSTDFDRVISIPGRYKSIKGCFWGAFCSLKSTTSRLRPPVTDSYLLVTGDMRPIFVAATRQHVRSKRRGL